MCYAAVKFDVEFGRGLSLQVLAVFCGEYMAFRKLPYTLNIYGTQICHFERDSVSICSGNFLNRI